MIRSGLVTTYVVEQPPAPPKTPGALTLAELEVPARVAPEALARALVDGLLGAALRGDDGDPGATRRTWELATVATLDPFVLGGR